ncbi:MAG: hypothetical protein HY332_07005 [Chloroflexi bacterium]|nr:hypothetical protein [Chloroflexota bacterium]
MFFRSGRFSPEAAAVELVGEALLCDVLDVTVERLGDWWIVSSSQDWLSAADVEKVFRRIVPFPEAGPNSMRAEVLLAAFCRDVVTQGSGRRLAIAGSPDAALTALFERTCRQGRAVAFRC